ncbi:MAG: PilZ domain-containing protein [Kofleriaceae bacterium]
MIAPWLRPMLWSERDWPRTLTRVAAMMATTGEGRAARAAELGRACEHVVPDRRRAIAAYATGGGAAELARAQALAVELGWWPAVARLALAGRLAGGPPTLAGDEVDAWLDAGEPALAATAIGDARAAAADDPWLRAVDGVLRGGADALAEAARVAGQARGHAPGLLTAARLARLGKDDAAVARYLAAAAAVAPPSARALALVLATLDDPAALHALVRGCLADLAPAAWVDTARALGLALVARPGVQALGLRLVRSALAQVYEHRLPPPVGHLAMWAILVEHAAQAGARPALLGLAAAALECDLPVDDRVWLAALGADIAWDDAGELTVARAWAAAAAEHAPDHPSVRAIAAATPAVEDDGLVYLDLAAEPASGRSRQVNTALAALREAVARGEAPLDEVDVELGDLVEPDPPPAAVVTVATVAVAAAAKAIGSTPAGPPSRPSLIPTAAQSALGRLPGKLPALPVRAGATKRAPRLTIPLDAVVERPGQPPVRVVCRDISASGVFILTGISLALGATIELAVETPAAEAWSASRHRVRATVVRKEPRGYGLVFVSPSAGLVAEIARLPTG